MVTRYTERLTATLRADLNRRNENVELDRPVADRTLGKIVLPALKQSKPPGSRLLLQSVTPRVSVILPACDLARVYADRWASNREARLRRLSPPLRRAAHVAIQR
jgi:hypothetical protein